MRVEGLVGHEKHILDMFIMGRVTGVGGGRWGLQYNKKLLTVLKFTYIRHLIGGVAINSEKEANWLSIQRKRQSGCKFEERVNQPPMSIHPTSISQEKKIKFPQHPTPSPFLFPFFERQRLSE